MKILFYDGPLDKCPNPPTALTLDTKEDMPDGIAIALIVSKYFEEYAEREHLDHEVVWFTNSKLTLNHDYAWDEKNNHSSIYLWRDKYNDFINIEELTDKEICRTSDIAQMYEDEEFEEEKVPETYQEFCESIARNEMQEELMREQMSRG